MQEILRSSILIRMRLLKISICIVLLAGCASNIPDGIRISLPDAPTVAEVRLNVDLYLGKQVRWGGQLASVKNETNRSLLEIVSRNLYRGGRPQQSDYSAGRFLAILPGFIDPAIYSEEREITIFGTITGSTSGEIGNFNYQYPVVSVAQHALWQPIPERHYHSNSYPWYDPWYDPWHDPWHDPWPRRHYPFRH